MKPKQKSELIALAVGWKLDGQYWRIRDEIYPKYPAYYTDDAAAIRDVLPKLRPWVIDHTMEEQVLFQCESFIESSVDGTGPGDGQGETMAAAICEAYAASQGGWHKLEEKRAVSS